MSNGMEPSEPAAINEGNVEIMAESGATNNESVQIITPANGPGTPPARRRNKAEVIDIIDLCSDTPESNVGGRTRRLALGNKTCNVKGQMMCPICLKSYLHRYPTATECGHIFCQTCILQSLQIASHCTVCRKKIKDQESLICIHF